MALPQFFESTVIDPKFRFAAQFLVVPARTFESSEIPGEDVRRTADAFGIRPVAELTEPHELVSALTLTLADLDPDAVTAADISNLADSFTPIRDFAHIVVNEAPIPFERSPLEGLTLSAIADFSATGIGALLGFKAVAAGVLPGLVLVVAVPTGIVFCVAAKHLGDGIGLWLRDRIYRTTRGDK